MDQHAVPALVSDRPGPLAAIQRLHIDILYIIFENNIDDLNPLQTARHTSQVCSRWRNSLLSASSIWGRIINLSELQIENDVSPWRDVVMERTGDSPLSISGEVPMRRVGWFLDFLSPFWEKVRHIDVLPVGFGPLIHDLTPNYLYNSPRFLETFHFPRVGFNPQPPWIANLRGITLGPPLDASDILQLLPTIPFLEYARFKVWHWYPLGLGMAARKRYPAVLLPHLAYIYIDHFSEEVTYLLQHIVPKKGCIYDIHTFGRAPEILGREIVRGVFRKCLRPSFRLSSTNALKLSVRQDVIYLRTVERPGTFPRFTHRHEFNLYLRQLHTNISTFLTNYLSHPSSSTFGKVTAFIFHAAEEPEINGRYDLNQCVDIFKQFLSLFPAVSTLGLSQRSLRLLTEMCDDDDLAPGAKVLFPSLKNVQLDVGGNDQQFDAALQILLPLFLDQRRCKGRPIMKLYISAQVATESDVDWSFLDDLHGLEVVWFREKSSDMGPLLDVDHDIISTYGPQLAS